MGAAVTSLYAGKVAMERALRDSTMELKRAMSKSNSMEALDKALIADLKTDIRKSESVLCMFESLLEAEAAAEAAAAESAVDAAR